MSEPGVEADTAVLRLVYDGDEYQGEIGAAELAEVIRSLHELAQAISGSGDLAEMSRPRVRVKPFEEGSFGIEAIIDAIGPGGGLLGIAGAVGGSFAFYWKNMRRVVARYVHHPEDGTYEVTLVNGETMQWTEQEFQLYRNRRAKKAAHGIAAPLRNGASLRVETTSTTDEIPAEDAYKFDPPDEPDSETDHFDVWATPDTVSFDPDKKWRLTSGEMGSFTAAIEDKRFLENVALGRVRIGKNDSFKLGIRTVTTDGNDGKPKRQWFVERVIEYHQGAEQDALIDADADSEE